MMRNPKIWILGSLGLLGYMALTWKLGSLLNLRGTDLFVLRFGLWLLGLIAATLIIWYLVKTAKRRKGAAVQHPPGDDIDRAFIAAKERLTQARVTGRKSLSSLPMVIILGPEGSTKTTTMIRSGVAADLLAGEIHRGDQVAPTDNVNLWYSRGTVFVEAGGKLLDNDGKWERFVKHIRQPRLAAVFAGRSQAPRVAVVCISCEELESMRGLTGSPHAGAPQAFPPTIRRLRDRLAKLSQALGVRLPVYVMFTKSDRIPYFAEFTRNLTELEVNEVLGCTLRTAPPTSTGLYADREYQRISDAYGWLFNSLAQKRLQFLPRETDLGRAGGAYEFPRELNKLIPVVTQCLIEICRPSELHISPYLRGFYFSGVRAVMVGEEAPASAQAAPSVDRIAATQVFDYQRQRQAAQAAAPATMKRVPQWLFIERLFRDVVLNDRVAMGATKSGVGLNQLRRLALASATGLSILLALGFIVSFFGNRRLESRTLNAARSLVGVVSSEPELPPLETFEGLEAVRTQVERLGKYERDGPPLRLRWGLYSGSSLYAEIREIYHSKLNELVLDPTRFSLLNSLRSLPDDPNETSEYGSTYDWLKAYLMITTNPDRLEESFLVPVALEGWLDRRQVDEQRLELATRQFQFYSTQLCQDYTCAVEGVAAVVARTRRFLRQFAGTERIYQLMISQASASSPSLQFNQVFPGSARVLVNPYQIPGAFTDPGWQHMQASFGKIDEFFRSEDWVIGEQAAMQQDQLRLAQDLRAMYISEYVDHWRQYLSASSVVRFANSRDASQKLAQLSGNESPLLQLFALASQNTAVDSLTVSKAFQPLHVITPPDITDKYVGESNQAYMNGLAELSASVEQVAAARGDAATAASNQALSTASNAKVAITQVAQNFSIEPEARTVGSAVQALMRAPITNAEGLLRTRGTSELNQRARTFCRSFGPLTANFPFNPNTTTEADVGQMSQMLQPNNSALWTFYDEVIQSFLVRQGNEFVVRPGASVNPRREFVTFFNRAAAISEALWQGDIQEPRLQFTFRPRLSDEITDVTFSVDGQTRQFTRTSSATWRYVWRGGSAREVRLTAHIRGSDHNLVFEGPWAIFKLFHRATWETEGGRYIVRWEMPTQGDPVTLEAELNLAGAPPLLQRDYLAGAACVNRITR